MNRNLILGAALTFSLLTACTQQDKAEDKMACVPASQMGIVNGTKVLSTDPLAKRVVMLLIVKGQEVEICTGTPITKDVILTAGHCVLGAEKTKIAAVFHTDMTCESGFDVNTKSVRSKDFIVKPGYSGAADAVDDIALVKLSSSIPSDYVVSDLYDGRSTLSSDVVTLAGYGKINELYGSSGYLRTTTKSFKKDLRLVNNNMNLLMQQADTGICQGDSGGPVFVEVGGRLQIAGVNSIVSGLTEATVCHYRSVSMYTPYYADWIQTQLGNLR